VSGILEYLRAYIDFFPLFVFLCLLLAGLNFPISEDLLIISSAILTRADRSLLIPSLIAIYSGVIISDFMVYWIGTRIRKGVSKSKFISKVLTPQKLDKMHYYLDKYGIFTFIVCRFIPFGVRNTLFMASGIIGLRLFVFALYDITAALISTNVLFFLIYHLGEEIEKPFKAVGIILFIIIIAIAGLIITRLFLKWRKSLRGILLSPKEKTDSPAGKNNPPE
jgi:membrane protein DedA with SNARE-associated domain